MHLQKNLLFLFRKLIFVPTKPQEILVFLCAGAYCGILAPCFYVLALVSLLKLHCQKQGLCSVLLQHLAQMGMTTKLLLLKS